MSGDTQAPAVPPLPCDEESSIAGRVRRSARIAAAASTLEEYEREVKGASKLFWNAANDSTKKVTESVNRAVEEHTQLSKRSTQAIATANEQQIKLLNEHKAQFAAYQKEFAKTVEQHAELGRAANELHRQLDRAGSKADMVTTHLKQVGPMLSAVAVVAAVSMLLLIQFVFRATGAGPLPLDALRLLLGGVILGSAALGVIVAMWFFMLS